MATEDDELKGKYVQVEVHLRSGAGGEIGDTPNARTLLYQGIYQKTTFVGTQEMLVLTEGQHYNRAHVVVPGKGKNDDDCFLIRSKKTYIALNDIVSIDVD